MASMSQDEEYLEAAEEESALDNLRDIVHQKVSFHHPIVCDTVNVYTLCSQTQPKSLA